MNKKAQEISKEDGLALSTNGHHPISGHLKVDTLTGSITIVVNRIEESWAQAGDDKGYLPLDHVHCLRFFLKPNQCSQLETAGVELCKEQTRSVTASATAVVTIDDRDVTFYAGANDSIEGILGELEPDEVAPIHDWDCVEFESCAVVCIEDVKDEE